MKCFFHSADLDGHASGAIIKYEFSDCEMIGINHGDKFPWDTIEKDEVVFMVDFSLQSFDNMLKLNNMCEFIWIDHHQSAIEKELEWCKKQKVSVKYCMFEGLRRNGIGACALVWEFLYPQRPVPYGIQMLAEYDVWNHKNPETLPFQYGMRIENTWPDSYMWSTLFSYNNTNFINKKIAEGSAILKYVDQSNKLYAKGGYFLTEFEGYKCMVINKALANSQLFDSVKNENEDIKIAFSWRKGTWNFSLYSKTVDVSKIAMKYGGGGHEGAAGFQSKEIPFKLTGIY